MVRPAPGLLHPDRALEEISAAAYIHVLKKKTTENPQGTRDVLKAVSLGTR